MSELLLRGFNPAKSYLDMGIDIILENGLKIQVKSAHGCLINKKKNYQYTFGLTSARYKKGKKRKNFQDLSNIDFLILWGIDTDVFYIIPADVINGKYSVSAPMNPMRAYKYQNYKDGWEQLK